MDARSFQHSIGFQNTRLCEGWGSLRGVDCSGRFTPPGEFTVQDDRQKLAPVLVGALTQKLLSLLRCQDVVGYRIFLNQQTLGRSRSC